MKISFVLSGFEMAMPIVGLLAGHGLGRAIGDAADYLAAAALFALGAWMLLSEEDNEGERVAALAGNSGAALIGLGISTASTSWRWDSLSACSISRSCSP